MSSDRQSAWRTMDRGSWHYTVGSDQHHPQEKEMQKGKMVVWGAKGKGEKERYKDLNAEFQRIARRDKKAFLATLWNSAFKWVCLSFSPLLLASLLFTAICKASSDSHFAFLLFFFIGMVLFPVSCTVSQTSVNSSSGTLSIWSSPLNLFLISHSVVCNSLRPHGL